MAITFNTSAMQYKENEQIGWQPLTITSNADITSLAQAFSTSETYLVGEYVRYNCRIYRCITAVTTAGAWNASNWVEVNIGDEFADLKVGITDRYGVVISDTEPSDPQVNGWLDTSTITVEAVPQIDDTQTSATDTYSSSKINSTYLAFGAAQSLSDTEQTQMCSNMGFVSGSNTYGYYSKFPDGTLIQWGTLTVKSGTTGTYVSLYTLSTTVTFPLSFYDTNYALTGAARFATGASLPVGTTGNLRTKTNCSVHLWDATSRTASSSTYWSVTWMAIGRWK